MFDEKSVFSKYVGYVLIGFFLLIIILSFGMPDVSGCGSNKSSVTVVNGENVDRIEFLRYRDMRLDQFKKQLAQMNIPITQFNMQDIQKKFLDDFIFEIILMQKAKKSGFSVTEDRIARSIKNIEAFKNQSTGKFDPAYFQNFLIKNSINIEELEKQQRRFFILDDYNYFITMGGASSKEDVLTKNIAENSSIQIQYSFLSTGEIRERYRNELAVTDADIDFEIKNNNVKISDPTTDRERIRKQVEAKKLEKVKNDLAEKINSIASSEGSFASANSILKGKIAKSAKFRIGEPVKTDEKEPKPVDVLNKSIIFTDKCLKLAKDKTSPAITNDSGIYIFSPLVKVIPSLEPDEETLKKSSEAAHTESTNMIRKNLNIAIQKNQK